jgi:3-phenylpropionate/cinnamic acid dioxygenase small subunit
MSTHIDSALLAQAQDLLHQEAWLLDKQRFADWLDLYTQDATYWVPLEQDQVDPFQTSSIIYDDRVLLELRVQQYTHSRAHARKPLARTVHQVGNVRLLSADPAELTVASTLVLIEYRLERQRTWAAMVEHRLRVGHQGLRIAAKRVDLVNSDSELPGIAFLL